jgi:glycosyltransferase involved in cell wall biosynthesis
VILEAMARGLAIIATDVGATREIVSAQNGKLISKLTVGTLKLTLQAMTELSDRDIDAMKQASLDQVTQYTWEQVSEDTRKSIEGVLCEK